MNAERIIEEQKRVNDYLAGFITPDRREKMESVLRLRQRYITVVLEDIFQPHNVSAVLRSCDAFGVQDLHIIENRNRYRINPDVELGTAQWLNINRYNGGETNTPQALSGLKEAGYRLIAALPGRDQPALNELGLEAGPVALMFGTELTGLSQAAVDMADESFSIPMHGFVESFNISVAVAITLHSLDCRLRESDIDWRLSDQEREDIRGQWLRSSVKKAAVLEREFLNGMADGR